MDNTLLESALEYAKKERPVFPVAQSKAPMTDNGVKDATTDEAQIRQWWEENPQANIGMATGQIFAVDLDPPDGPESWFFLTEEKEVPATTQVKTPSGGRHLYFQAPTGVRIKNSVSGLGDGVDVRGHDGYVIVPPSTIDGSTYKYAVQEEIANAPFWLLSEVVDEGARESKERSDHGGAEEAPDTIPEGQRNDKLTSIAGTIRNRGMSVEEMEEMLQTVNEKRCEPPLSSEEVQKIAQSVGRYEPGAPVSNAGSSEESDSKEGEAAKDRVDAVVEKVQGGDAGAELVFDHLEDFARLDTADFAVAKDQVSDAVNLNDFNEAIREARRKVERKDFKAESDLPVIQVSGRPGREIVDEAKEALHEWNDPPTLFQRGTEPAQIATDDQGQPIIRELPEPVLDDRIDRAADFYRSTEKRGAVRTDLSKRYVQRIRETIDLPPLDGIVEVPVLRKDGSILDEPGYDEGSRLYYRPDEDLDMPDVPRDPTGEQVAAAKEMIWKPLQDFPFVNRASKANALALMLTPIIRPQLAGQNVPLAIVDATVQGTGKTLFVNVVSRTATGRTAGTMSAPEGDEEWRKQITAQLLQGASMIVVDNVRGRLQSAPLEQALTTSLWQDRVLGKSQQVELPQRATWVATGNNVQPKGDMTRRVYPIRMDAEMERPWTGRDFEISNLEQWTRQHRGKLVASLLTLARAWTAAGEPDPDVELLGSFEEWTRTVGGILQHAGVEGFLDNLETLYEHVDEETSVWAGFLEALHVYFQTESVQGSREDATFTTKELGGLIRDEYSGGEHFNDNIGDVLDKLPDYLRQKLNRGDPISRTLGNMFAHRRGRRFGPEQWRIEVARTRKRTKQWIVRRKPKNSESSESSNTPAGETPPHLEDENDVEGGGGVQQNRVNPDSLDSSEPPFDDAPF
jgi:hypothetical protein